ncbi:DNA-directed RNA polymerase subunit alpha [Metamycoplasma equirhinis]|uniref:DNA-directed RNA polymerase subunit alpha n=1 Tax=Metamycoplasma equirhinis TaxID=92402 RepID=A0ABZ0PAU0_9BACT|nr:DNA-directed RNA polymerase subunit alpha [Metamycoplasma equirhinis]TPD98307.1 DNA-directed RNA polymerase subunit alpha [Metamycoplasma equirhinis]WPB54143.1 DNA-directed RNA polymerase subunit alpha [Metamycoplasma equirhinis]BDX52586.1 DNA-directed RNA polymerase subunit alpha [Metamycoplasma equirhinis]
MEKIQKITYKELVAEKESDFKTTFVIEPLMRGYGNTMGTVIRRTLLSSITSVAPFAIKINNVEHEFQTIPGIKEDAITLVANIRKIRFTYNPEIFTKDNLAKVSLKFTNSNNESEVTASNIESIPGLDIVNLDQHIATLSDGATLEFDLFLRTGRGFIDFEENKSVITEYGSKLVSKIENGQILAIDSDFSPVKKCGISYEDLNSSSKTIEERLKINIETDGTVLAKEAMEQAAKIIVAHFQIIGNIDALETINLFDENKEKKEKTPRAQISIEKLNLTIRSLNALKRAGFNTIDELEKLSDEELSNIKNLGKKSVQDIVDKRRNWMEKRAENANSSELEVNSEEKKESDTNTEEGEE